MSLASVSRSSPTLSIAVSILSSLSLQQQKSPDENCKQLLAITAEEGDDIKDFIASF